MPRTILDLATVLSGQEVARALDRAETLRVFDARAFDSALRRFTGRAGTGVVRAILDANQISEIRTRNELEERFRHLIGRHQIPPPEPGLPIKVGERWIEADFIWPAARLVVELDGFATHGTRKGFRDDRRRDRETLMHTDLAVLRFTWEEIWFEEEMVAETLRTMLRLPDDTGAVATK